VITRRFRQVDVFTAVPYRGNPVAVVLDGQGLGTEEMQRFAHWTNLSETTFLLPPDDPDADYRVRIFTPDRELPFAGHPTLGSCHAWLEAGGVPAHSELIVQQCGAGLVSLRHDGGRLAFAAPPLVRSGPVDEQTLAAVVELLGIDRAAVVDANWVDNGPGWVAVLLGSVEEVLAIRPGTGALDVGVVAAYPAGSPEAFEVRGFFPVEGRMVEDPVTGSLNASLAGWLLGSGRAQAPYVARQGTVLGRSGLVHVGQDADGTVWTGGESTTCVEGTVQL
jgi:PhzF family phenazine biosynthesis protein